MNYKQMSNEELVALYQQTNNDNVFSHISNNNVGLIKKKSHLQ